MLGVLKKLKRCMAVCLCVALFMTTGQVTMAQENADSEIMQEYMQKVDEGKEVYLLVDEKWGIFGYYESYDKENFDTMMPRYGANINWTVGPHAAVCGENVYTLSEGCEINVSITVSQEGKSYLGLYDTATNSMVTLYKTESSNGFNGKIVINSNFPVSTYSFGIINASDNTITYTGHYTL